jgi:hypothetical protein
MKIRMMGNPLFVDTMNAMGGNGIAMGYGEVFTPSRPAWSTVPRTTRPASSPPTTSRPVPSTTPRPTT